jgi:hypothetical protein
MLNYLKKFTMDILPSVAATIIGAYIVNHYINAKPADVPAAAAVSKAFPKSRLAPKPASAETAAIPEPGIKAKGISERAMIETRASERPAEVKPDAKPAEATAETKPAETAKPSESAKLPETTKPSDVATAPHRRDAADLARAAIERLRGSKDTAPRIQEAPRVQEAPRTQEAARTPPAAPAAPRIEEVPRTVVAIPPAQPASVPEALRPLPPPITVTVPPSEPQIAGAPAANPPYTASVDPNRPVPPAEIPPAPPRPPIDLRADADKLANRTTNMAQDVLAKTRNMFHALLPGNDRQSSSASQFTD